MSHSAELAGKAVLVTGAAGCIGAWVVKQLRELGATPVVFDIAENRERLDLIMPDAEAVIWELGDITDFERLLEVAETHNIEAIIHLAALQVPFRKADPVGSTRINVMEHPHAGARPAARHYANELCQLGGSAGHGGQRLAGHPLRCAQDLRRADGRRVLAGLGVPRRYSARYYLRSGRDQGMSAAPTIALMAAEVGEAYTIPFTGRGFCLRGRRAERFIAAASRRSRAPTYLT